MGRSRYRYSHWRPYVPVAERRRRSARKVAKLAEAGQVISPVEIAGRKIATTFWGQAWCENLEAYSDYSNRLPRGRTYVRNGSVIDLQIETGRVRSLVSGSDLYEVEIEIKKLPGKRWTGIQEQCAGKIESLVELLRGSLSKGVMEVVTAAGDGLFPAPREITLSCSCPDWAGMCKHVAATLYGVGARLDHEPELLFRLRGVDPTGLVEVAIVQPARRGRPARGRLLETNELSSVFGIEIEAEESPAAEIQTPSRRRRGAGKKPAAKQRLATRLARLPRAALERLQDRGLEFATESVVLRELLQNIELARGRLYCWRAPQDLMARITPLSPRSMLLQSRRDKTWIEQKRGPMLTVLKALESDSEGVFHGLGSLLTRLPRGGVPTPQVVLHRQLRIPIPVLVQHPGWHSINRRPEITELGGRQDRALVSFVSEEPSGPSRETCLYARRHGEWNCYMVDQGDSLTIASAESWLEQRGWETD